MLDELFFGCLRVEKTERGLLPLRFSDARLARYDQTPQKPYARCPVGVRLAFVTDAAEVSFSFSLSRAFFFPTCFDIYENGRFAESAAFGEGEREGTVSCRRRAEGRSLVEIYLPAAAEVTLRDLSLGDWTRAPERLGGTLLALGDSIAQGVMSAHPSLNPVSRLARLWDCEALNLSVGGDCLDPDWLDEGVCAPDRVLAALGTNDFAFGQPLETIEKNAFSYFERLASLYAGADIAVVTPPPIVGLSEPERTRFERVRDIAARAASASGLYAVDGYDLLPAPGFFLADHCHPNDLGNAEYALNLARNWPWNPANAPTCANGQNRL